MLETYLPLYSSHIEKAAYETDTQDLTVTFKDGAEYVYRNVPQSVFDGLKKSRSAGEYFHRQIKGVYGYEEV